LKKVLVLGATSTVAMKVIELLAKEKVDLYLVARSQEKLEIFAEKLKNQIQNTQNKIDQKMTIKRFNVQHFDEHEELIQDALKTLGGLDLVFVAYGSMTDQKKCHENWLELKNQWEINFLSVTSYLHYCTQHFQKQGWGQIGVITSVAGDRGRQSNYSYGVSKGALSIYLQGLRNRLYPFHISVTDIKLGFVDSPMTKDLAKRFFICSPTYAAKLILWAIKKKSDIIYIPNFWKWIMLIIKMIPESLFKKMNF